MPQRNDSILKRFLRLKGLKAIGASIGTVILALLIGALLIALIGIDPWSAYAALWDGAVGNKNSIAETLLRSIPLAVIGLGITVAFRASVFNVGAEGQLYLGAVAAA